MSDKTIRELTREELDSTSALHEPIIAMFKRLSAEFAQLTIRSLFVLHGGALFVLPAYVAAVSPVPISIDRSALMSAGGSFVVGCVSQLGAIWPDYTIKDTK